MHGGNGVARVDGALEGVGAIDLGDVADLRHVQLGSHARCDVLARCGSGEQDVAVVLCNRQNLGCDVLSRAVFQARAFGQDDLGDACDLRGGLCSSGCTFTGDEHMHIPTTCLGGGDDVQRGGLDRSVVVFCHDQNIHECGHFLFSLSVRSLWLRSSACPPAWPRPAP
ncbi:hypothetical protein SDC9_113616 [bioreactor metagenome]|uniref:Uncharacterized protein n=1 Tax=bioreactor metagenome TaxID=1076179 RepID=A0A645BN79_9ZZZZ